MLSAIAMAAVSGCTSDPDRGPGPRRPPPSFQAGELRSVPDPLTMLTASLRKDLRLHEDRRRSMCKNSGFLARGAVARWDCTLRPPQKGRVTFRDGEANPTYRAGEIRVGLEVHHPASGQTATTRATTMYAQLKESMFLSKSRILPMGDEGFMSPTAAEIGDANLAFVRVRNVVLSVTANSYPVRRRPTSTDMDRLTERIVAELARSLARLRT